MASPPTIITSPVAKAQLKVRTSPTSSTRNISCNVWVQHHQLANHSLTCPHKKLNAGTFVALMMGERAAGVRAEALRAIIATTRAATLTKLLHSGSFSLLLDAWLREAVAEWRTSLLRLLLQALARLPLTVPQLRSGALLKTVNSLQGYKWGPQTLLLLPVCWCAVG